MNILFLVFHGFNPANGISKKISYQIDALRELGHEVHLCHFSSDENGYKTRWVDDMPIRKYGNGLKGKILKRIEFDSIAQYAIQNRIELVYMRSDHNANLFTIRMARKMKEANIRIVMEIPTYPYDHEDNIPLKNMELLIDKCFRRQLAKQLHRIVTFTEYEQIFGIDTIRISNGIDFSRIKLKQHRNDTIHELHLIGVAEIHLYHGFDRLILGLLNYYANDPEYKVYFHLVGDFFGQQEENSILPLLRHDTRLSQYVILHGAKHGEELDALFENADMGIGSLARHRSKITRIKTLKNREYAARGPPFIYSEIDSDFEDKPYILKVSADETPIDIPRIISFYKQQKYSPEEIRHSIQDLSWKTQMERVLKAIDLL